MDEETEIEAIEAIKTAILKWHSKPIDAAYWFMSTSAFK